MPVEIYFSSEVGKAGAGALDLSLLAPKFDLPLENLTWRVFLNDKWQRDEMERRAAIAAAGSRGERRARRAKLSADRIELAAAEKRRKPEQMLALGNSALQNGDPQQARRAFESAYGLSRNDAAFNEDARVQLNNLKLQQALVGLNVRQAAASGGNGGGNIAVNGTLNNLRNNGFANYTQQDAKQIIDNNSADENSAFMKLAERLIQQQDAAVANPAVIRANVPEQGRLLTFKRAVVVDTWADLNINLAARTVSAVPWSLRLAALAVTALLLAGLGLLARRLTAAGARS